MPYINSIDRYQIQMLSLDERVEQDSEVRVIDAFVSSLDLKKLGVAKAVPAMEGRPAIREISSNCTSTAPRTDPLYEQTGLSELS